MVRLVLSVALVANVLVLVLCSAETTQATATSESSASATSSSSHASSSSSSKSSTSEEASLKPKCRKGKKCPKHEEFSSCPKLIERPQLCSEKAEPSSTHRATWDKSSCKEGCVCKKNFLRAENGTCIPAELCPLTCGVNEVLDNCPSDCVSDYCPTKEVSEASPCVTPDVCPPPKCKCAFNHRRACNGTCISTRDCPPFPCKTNEEFNACPPLCPTDDCSQASPTGECPPQFGHIGIILPCNPKCRCIKGYWRLDDVCVPYGQCPGVCPDHEKYSECIQGECRALDCALKDQPISCAGIDPKYCQKGCVCEEGYFRNRDGVCVKEDKCEPPSCISANEEFVPCMQGVCRAKNCSEKGQDVPCPDIPPEQCDSGCICKEHFLRAANGTCVPEDQCEPSSCPVNEELSNCTQKECRAQDCFDRYLSIPCPSIPEESCEKGCVCQWGYLRDKNNVCIPADECPVNPCPYNQRPSNCTQEKCVQKCSDERMQEGCPVVAEGDCKEGCVCQNGYLQAEDGYCVPENECESTKCPPFERWAFCSNANCGAEHCYQKGWSLPCPGVSKCIPGCLCQEGYLRNDAGVCVPEAECNSPSCPDNEEPSNCTQNICRAQDCFEKYSPLTCPDISEESCKKGCVCRYGFLRDQNGVCIPDYQCPENTCIHNQRLSNCTQAKCVKKCSDERMPEGCPVVAEGDCTEGCVCQDGYLQAEDGYCVPEDQCESTKCPPFEQWSFCSNAVCRANHCYEKDLFLPCPGVSECVPGCLCDGGYLRNESGVCVPEAECKESKCPHPNERWSTCAQGGCRARNCTEKDMPIFCPTIAPGDCKEACVCKENHLRNAYGDCIPEDECDPVVNCGENENPENCPTTCNTDNCPQSADEEEVCTQPELCVPSCKCRFNYRRAANGTCIPTTECPPFDCSAKENEEFVACPPYCPSDECGKPRLEGRCPFRIGIILECKPKCQCKDGYGRVNGTCVPFEECPDLCPDNEVYSPCVQETCRPQNCSDRDVAMEKCPTSDPASCQRGCVCKENFYRNDKGVCVSYKECGVARYKCDGNQTAEPACACESGYLRLNETSPCIPICECPEMANSPDCA